MNGSVINWFPGNQFYADAIWNSSILSVDAEITSGCQIGTPRRPTDDRCTCVL